MDFTIKCGEINCDEVKGRLIRNPQYGGPGVGLNGWRWRPTISNHTKPDFQQALEDDIAENGVRNPILVWSLPEGLFLTFGGSRLRACLKLGIPTIPAIVNDYTERYSAWPTVTPDNWAQFFTDPPRAFEFGEHGADYHYNLERARRHDHDPAGIAWLEDRDQSFIKREFPWLTQP